MHSLFIIISCAISIINSLPTPTTMRLSLTSLRLPLITLCSHHQLLLDTGSSQVWIADAACVGCPITTSACPHINKITTQIDYFKGSVSGDMTYINTCLGTLKVFCVKQAHQMDKLEAVGILGIQAHSSGRRMLEALTQSHLSSLPQPHLSSLPQSHLSSLPQPSSLKSISIYYGIKEAQIFLGQPPQHYVVQSLAVTGTGEWKISMKGVKVDQQQLIAYNCQILVDTGSNLLILPSALFRLVTAQIDSALRQLQCTKMETLSFSCAFPASQLPTFISFQVSPQSFLRIALAELAQERATLSLMIEQSDKEVVVVGVAIFRDYLVEFPLEGSLGLAVYEKNRQVEQMEASNLRTSVGLYLVAVVLVGLLADKAHELVEGAINRKIVI